VPPSGTKPNKADFPKAFAFHIRVRSVMSKERARSKPAKSLEKFSGILVLTRQKNPSGHICRAIGANPSGQTPNELLTNLVQLRPGLRGVDG
jgi:hypothetical protein